MDLRLPAEIWLMIFALLERSDWKRLRLSCRHLSHISTPVLFETVYFELYGSGCTSLGNIASTALAACVKTLVLRQDHGWRRFPDSRTWRASVYQPGDPGRLPVPPAETSHYHDSIAAEDLLPYSDWMSLSEESQDRVYHEYEADCTVMEERARDMAGRLRFELPNFEPVLIRPYQGLVRQSACDPVAIFQKALETLENVKELRHQPGFVSDPNWGCRWRNLYLHPWALATYTSHARDEDMEALQLSVALRTLAIVRRRQIRIQSMKLYIGGPSIWGPKRLQRLWFVGDHERTRAYRSLYTTAAEADKAACIEFSDPEQSKLYLYQLCYMKQALTSLTELACSVSEDDERNGSLGIAGKYLYEYLLSPTKNLERIRLVFGRLANGILPPGNDCHLYAKDSVTLLDQLARRTPWSRMRSMELEIVTHRSSLTRFLLAHVTTLQSLTLTRVTLLRLEDSLNTWEPVLHDLVRALSLQTLHLVKLSDFVLPQASGKARRRTLFDVDADIWQGKATEYTTYHRKTTDCLLRGDHVQLL
jgi:hypothetical protein